MVDVGRDRRSLMVNAYQPGTGAQLDRELQKLVDRRTQVLGAPYRLFYEEPVRVIRGDGAHLFDADGNDYLDAYNNVPAVGHSNPRVRDAVADQLSLVNTHTRYLTDAVVDYAERLTDLFPSELSQAIFACTGSEAVDLALRMVRHATGGQGIIITKNAYHGTTTAAAEISPSLGPRNVIPQYVEVVDAPDPIRGPSHETSKTESFLASIEQAIFGFERKGIPFAGMIVDSVLSSDGLVLEPTGFLQQAAALVRKHGGLYIADEVQPGFGRTGHWWGFERHGLVPDLVVLGKPMGNGIPISAVIGSPAVFDKFGNEVRYFNTFGGSPVSIAAANAVLDEIRERDLLAHVTQTGVAMLEGMRGVAGHAAQKFGLQRVGDVRGAGLFLSVEYVQPDDGITPDRESAQTMVNALRTQKILVSASGRYENVLKIRPPLVFTDDDVSRFLDGFAIATEALFSRPTSTYISE